MDSRSTVRTAVQDTRLVKIYQDWVELRKIPKILQTKINLFEISDKSIK